MSEFVYTTCQVGAESALKAELARDWPDLRLAFSRPGFLTFKLPKHHRMTDACDLRCVFARSSGFSLGKTSAATLQDRAAETWRLASELKVDRVHVWQRERIRLPANDAALPRDHLAGEAREALLGHSQGSSGGAKTSDAGTTAGATATLPVTVKPTLAHDARVGNLVLDCVVVEPGEWWIGYHRAHDTASCWPGGVFPGQLPAEAVSRAYLKMDEALAWSQMPVAPGDLCVEIGSAPGGASQALLARGLNVIGVDPAEMDDRVLANPHFTHWRKRGAEVRRREYRKIRWLTADVNVAPNYTLDMIESIVTYPEVKIRGVLLTLKLLDWSLADEIPEYLERVRSWGYNQVTARQLSHNRQEICVVAQRVKRHRPTA